MKMQRGRDDGSVTVFVAVLMVALMILVGLVGDGGAAMNAEIRAIHESAEAARIGARALDVPAFHRTGARVVNPDAARTAVQRYLASTGDTGTVVADQNTVKVDVIARHSTWLLGLVGVRSIAVGANATAHPEATP